MFAEGLPFTIISQNPPFALSIPDEPGSRFIVGRQPNGSNDQKWILTREGDGIWVLKNAANGKFLGIEGEPRVDVRVIEADSPTLWRVQPGADGPDYYWIFPKDSDLTVGLRLFVIPPSPSLPAILQESPRQGWKFVAAEPL